MFCSWTKSSKVPNNTHCMLMNNKTSRTISLQIGGDGQLAEWDFIMILFVFILFFTTLWILSFCFKKNALVLLIMSSTLSSLVYEMCNANEVILPYLKKKTTTTPPKKPGNWTLKVKKGSKKENSTPIEKGCWLFLTACYEGNHQQHSQRESHQGNASVYTWQSSSRGSKLSLEMFFSLS